MTQLILIVCPRTPRGFRCPHRPRAAVLRSHPHVHHLGHRHHLGCHSSGARGDSIPETGGARCVVHGVWWSCKDPHNIKGGQATSALWVSLRLCDFKRLSADDLWVWFVVTELRACGSQVSEARAPWTFEHFAD